MKIAVFIDPDGRTASLYQPGTVRVFESSPAGWRPVRDIPFALDDGMGLTEIRTRTLSMLADLAGCRHFVARSITGALLSFFDGMGIVMWRLAGEPEFFLQQIQQRVAEQAGRASALTATAPGRFIQPGEAPGEYRLNLIDALQSDGALTSKQVLLPFFQHTPFEKIAIVCDHVPKWFKREFPRLKLAVDIGKTADGRCYAVVFPTPPGS
ncbi:Fe-only nitrogenase accessory protein AnfO [Sodalis sp. RH21]|uniref:Fe-only nitrogenase accessory protein AnfO n=1 Tax=unclassified Sodalis (in: enterobacteria) TaxID=2636512 RepID=UPI0039B4BC49